MSVENGVAASIAAEFSCAITDLLESCTGANCETDGVNFSVVNPAEFFGSSPSSSLKRSAWKKHVSLKKVDVGVLNGKNMGGLSGISLIGNYKNMLIFKCLGVFNFS